MKRINKIFTLTIMVLGSSLLILSLNGLAQTNNLLKNESFEAGGNGDWQEQSTNFLGIICDAQCTLNNSSQAHTGDYWVWFGGNAAITYTEIATLTQPFTVPKYMTHTTLSFWVQTPTSNNSGEDYLRVFIDNHQLFELLDTQPGFESNYQQIMLNVTDYLSPLQTYTLRFQAQTAAESPTSFFLDDVVLSSTLSPNSSPIFTVIPNKTILNHHNQPNAIDLWEYVTDDHDEASALNFFISNTPAPEAGISLVENRYISINPQLGWQGTTDVEIQAQDTRGAINTTLFSVKVIDKYNIHLPFLTNYYCNDSFTYNEGIAFNLRNINAVEAWAVKPCLIHGNEVIVAVLDTGVELTHQDLAANLVPGFSFDTSVSEPYDEDGHGTHVAGIIAGIANNNGIIGVAPKAKIMPVRVLDARGFGTTTWVANAVIWATDNGADIINMSLGSISYSNALNEAIQRAHQNGVLLVAAAGNCGDNNYFNNGCRFQNQTNYPGAYENVIAVAAIDSRNNRASFSNEGTYVDIAAPGASIYSSYIGNSYLAGSGTSQAAPHVSGLAALIKSQNPQISNVGIWSRIQSTATDLGASGRDNQYGYGLINAKFALEVGDMQLHNTYVLTPQTITEPSFAPGVVLLQLKRQSRVSISQLLNQTRLRSTHARVTGSMNQIGVYILSVPLGEEQAIVETLQTLPDVAFAELNYIVQKQ